MKRMIVPLLLMMALLVPQVGTAVAQDEDKPTITVGSKNYTEQLIMGEMLSLLLEDAGYEVNRQFYLGSTAIAHEGMVSGDIDTYVEYTGTGLIAILGQEVPAAEEGGQGTPTVPVEDQVYTIVAETYPEEFGIEWLKPIGFQNTFAIAVTQETAEEYDLQTISDLQGVAGELKFGADPEFAVREDGLPGLEEVYDIEFESVQTMDVGLLYSAVGDGAVDISVVASTDGRIPALDLVLLEDDKNFFPPYYAAPVIRGELLEQHPDLEEVLNQLAGEIDSETMQQLNAQVDEEGMDESEVARAFLEERGFIGGED